MSANSLTLDTVQQDLVKVLSARAEERAIATESAVEAPIGAGRNVAEVDARHFVGHVGDVKVTLSIEIELSETASTRAVTTGQITKEVEPFDRLSGPSGLWQNGL